MMFRADRRAGPGATPSANVQRSIDQEVTSMSMFSVIVEFASERIKPRTVKVEATTRKEARRAARAEIAAKHPTWKIKECHAKVLPTKRTLAEIRAEDEYPLRKAAALVADAFGARNTPAWWDAYRAEKAHLRAQVADAVTADTGVVTA